MTVSRSAALAYARDHRERFLDELKSLSASHLFQLIPPPKRICRKLRTGWQVNCVILTLKM